VLGLDALAPSEQGAHALRLLAERHVVGARIVQGLRHRVSMIARLATAKAVATSPSQLRALGVDVGGARSVEGVRHLAPRRERFARLGLGDHARGAAQLGAKCALRQLVLALGEHRQARWGCHVSFRSYVVER
jgi:hypothetical protein